MWCNQIFSLIADKEIKNIIVADNYEIASKIARSNYGEEAIAVDTTLYPVSIGCKYDNGIFTDEGGNEIQKNLTEAEEIELLKIENETLKSNYDQSVEIESELMYEISLLQLGLTDEEVS